MSQKLNILLIISLLAFSSFLLFSVLVWGFDLNEVQNIFSIFGSASIAVALVSYLYKKEQDQLIATVDQIEFFREKIIYEAQEVIKKIKIKDANFIVSRIEIKEPSLNEIKRDFSENFSRQLKVFFDNSTISIDQELLSAEVLLLNMLEEFALKVVFSKTIKNSAFNSLHNVFVELVEQNAVAILYMRDVQVGKPIYDTTLTLYQVWKKMGDYKKTNLIKNLEKFGLITKEQKEEVYRKRKEKHGI